MDRSSRFSFLLEAYRAGQLTEDEYSEFVHMLQDERLVEEDLDKYLTAAFQDEVVGLPTSEPIRIKSPRHLTLFHVAATTLIAVGISLLFYWLFSEQGQSRILAYETGYGEVKDVALPDGSSVRMNANTKLTWEDDRNRSGIRKVLLDGEAFFEVVKTPDNAQFLVEGKDILVKVLGTSFNVHSRSTASQVYLDEGRVVIMENAVATDSLIMAPGELATFDMETQALAVVSASESMRSAASWITGVLHFQDITLGEVLGRLTDLYGYEFELLDPRIGERQMYLGVPYGNWETVKSALEIALQVNLVDEGNSKYVIAQNSTK